MTNQNFTATISVDASPDQAFTAINNVRGWWSGQIEGDTAKLGSEFTYRYKDLHRTTQKITELIPGKRVVWHVVDCTITFVNDQNEWSGTDIVFDIEPKGDRTEVRFTHVGLVPDDECYGSCSNGWERLIRDNLRTLIATGDVQPDPFV